MLDKFDSAKDTRLCPAERTALSTFYHTAKGEEWTINTNWLSQYDSHCDWHGITCHGESVIELNLANNGLSGMLSKEIKKLRSLTYLNVADNDMKVRNHHMRSSLQLQYLAFKMSAHFYSSFVQ